MLRTTEQIPGGRIQCRKTSAVLPWLWDGYLMPGDLTLLVSEWKTGKTTLLTGLLRMLGEGKPILGRAVRQGRAVVISEESESHWEQRGRLQQLGDHMRFIFRPFLNLPTFDDWEELLGDIRAKHEVEPIDLLVIDPISSLFPSQCEFHPGAMVQMLQILRTFAGLGVAVLLIHHPKKTNAVTGSMARGSGSLLGFVDISLELTRYSSLPGDANRRLIRGTSRRPETPARLCYEYNPAIGRFATVEDPLDLQEKEVYEKLVKLLKPHPKGLTIPEMIDLVDDDPKPSHGAVHRWVTRSSSKYGLIRIGQGTRGNPHRYRLPNQNDLYRAMGEMPPLPGLEELLKDRM